MKRSIAKPIHTKPNQIEWYIAASYTHTHTLCANDIALWCALNMLVLDVIYDKIYDIFSNGFFKETNNATFNVK